MNGFDQILVISPFLKWEFGSSLENPSRIPLYCGGSLFIICYSTCIFNFKNYRYLLDIRALAGGKLYKREDSNIF